MQPVTYGSRDQVAFWGSGRQRNLLFSYDWNTRENFENCDKNI